MNSDASTQPAPSRNDFRCGEKVTFYDKYLQTVVGTIVRINDRTATIDSGDGTKWRVAFPLLRHVFEVSRPESAVLCGVKRVSRPRLLTSRPLSS